MLPKLRTCVVHVLLGPCSSIIFSSATPLWFMVLWVRICFWWNFCKYGRIDHLFVHFLYKVYIYIYFNIKLIYLHNLYKSVEVLIQFLITYYMTVSLVKKSYEYVHCIIHIWKFYHSLEPFRTFFSHTVLVSKWFMLLERRKP